MVIAPSAESATSIVDRLLALPETALWTGFVAATDVIETPGATPERYVFFYSPLTPIDGSP